VLLDGKPIGKANVTFVPVQEPGRHALARTEEDGRFTVKEGLLPGAYKVLVTVDARSEAGAFDIRAPEEYKKKLQSAARHAALPGRYADPETTPLRITAPPAGPLNLELTTKPAS
jgi:hypothetical protein